jgi:hypothetical protein
MSCKQPDIYLHLIHQQDWPMSKVGLYYKASVTDGKCSVG